MARKTRSSTATERVKRVAAFAPTMATCLHYCSRRTSGLCGSSSSVTGLKRNARRLWSAVRRADTRIADEHLAVAAVGAAPGNLRLRGNLIRRMAGRDGQKRNEASRSADGRHNAFCSDQPSIRIGGDQTRRRRAGITRPGASINQKDLSPRRRISARFVAAELKAT